MAISVVGFSAVCIHIATLIIAWVQVNPILALDARLHFDEVMA
jgi:hypothetical protein